MKKLLVLSLFLGLMGSAYALEKVDITTGVYMESENHNAEYNSSDVTVHGVRAKLDFKDFPLWTEFAYEYRNADSLSGHQGDEDISLCLDLDLMQEILALDLNMN